MFLPLDKGKVMYNFHDLVLEVTWTAPATLVLGYWVFEGCSHLQTSMTLSNGETMHLYLLNNFRRL